MRIFVKIEVNVIELNKFDEVFVVLLFERKKLNKDFLLFGDECVVEHRI